MSEYMSFIKEELAAFESYLVATQRNNSTYIGTLRKFDKYLYTSYHEDYQLTKEMFDTWCRKHDNESNNTCRRRIQPILLFHRYLKERKLIDFEEPEKPKISRRKSMPHPFTDEELASFFKTCDDFDPIIEDRKLHKVIKLILSVIFRLLYSTGLRPNEARLLKRSNVDLNRCVISITETKGHNQRFVAIHDSLIDILIRYDEMMNDLIPDRVYFFPNGKNGYYCSRWLRGYFRQIWSLSNPDTNAVIYDFRHNYAIDNINSWIKDGTDSIDKMYYLSKSMGHADINNTLYYYSVVPKFSKLQYELSNSSFEELIPEVMGNEGEQ